MLRSSILAFVVMAACLLAGAPARAVDTQLPSIGSSAGQVASPEEQRQIGFYVLHELRNQTLIVDDALLTDYLNTLGYRLVAYSPLPNQPFTFFIVRETEINAFALPGGFVGVNAGLITMTGTENELAAVLAHEISHVTQQHLVRAEEAMRKMTPLMVLAMVGAMVAASHQNPYSSSNADMGAIMTAQGLAQQFEINFTRADELEADRVGIQTLAKASFDPDAMAGVFERMQRAIRPTFDENDVPAMLMDHPVTVERISEAKARAEAIKSKKDYVPSVTVGDVQEPGKAPPKISAAITTTDNPATKVDPADSSIAQLSNLSPKAGATLAKLMEDPDYRRLTRARSEAYFELMRERVRVLVSLHPAEMVSYYAANLRDTSGFDRPANQYGYALALIHAGKAGDAIAPLQKLTAAQPENLVFQLALGEAELFSGARDAALQRYARVEKDFPANRALALAHADALMRNNDKAAGRQAQDILRPQLAKDDEDPDLQVSFARACELAGDAVRAGEAHATAAYLNGRAEDALNQLKLISKRSDLDYYQRTRVEALIEQMTPAVLELRRRNIKPSDQGKFASGFSACISSACSAASSLRNN
jgi:beta-barrel assembly-enhancing protease